MKNLNSKILAGPILLALLIGSNGCMTQSTIQYAQGHPAEAWINNMYGYKYKEPLIEYPEPKPDSAYYCWLPLSVPVDVVTSPIQLIVIVYGIVANGGVATEIPN